MRLIRFLKLFFIFLIFLGLSVLLATQTGDVAIRIGEQLIEMPLSFMLIGVVLIGGLLLLSYQLWSIIWSIPERYQAFLDRKKKQKAQNLMIDGLTSLAAWQPSEAKASTDLAEKLLPNNPIVTYIAAQSAQLANDPERASQLYSKMLQEHRMKFIGLRGLAAIAKSKKDVPHLMNLLNQAFDMRHDSPWVLEEWLETSTRMEFMNVYQNIDKHPISKQLERERWYKHLGIIYAIRAQRALFGNALMEARNHLKKTIDYRPSLTWGVCHLATLYQQDGNTSKAQRLLQNAYGKNPHRSLGYIWISLYPSENVVEQLRHLEKLTKESPQHYESYFLLGAQAIKAHIWGQALHYMQQAFQIYNTHEAYSALKEIQQHLAALPHVHETERSLSYNFGWHCQSCGFEHHEWAPLCHHCDAVDHVEWAQEKTETTSLLMRNKEPMLTAG